jgi:hypothetical protein
VSDAEDPVDESATGAARPPLRPPARTQDHGEDLYQLKLWRESEPDAPDGERYKDFGTFKICGEGKYPKTFLLKGQAARGEAL